ncbi:MAG: clostripain-related cysteine peptidase [Thermoplasmata archaeon]|nr:clostripain-related cysteine peptidase [Thermoplasmata archaeon]
MKDNHILAKGQMARLCHGSDGGTDVNKRFVVCCFSIVVAVLVIAPGVCLAKQSGGKWTVTESWTVALYISGDNSLERFWDDSSLPGLLNLPANDMLRIVAYVDRLSTEGTEVVEISGDSYEVVAAYPEKDFGNGATFQWFLTDVADKYPSDKLAVVAWDHGYAWRYISDDATSGSRITMPTFQTAIEDAGVYMDILAFDACNMAAVEVVYQVSLTGLVGIVVASEESVPTTGFPYDLMLMPTALDSSRSPAQFASDMVAGFEAFYAPQTWASTVALSAISVPAIAASADNLIAWASSMRSCLPLYASSYKQAVSESYFAWATHYHVDIADFGDALLADTTVTDETLRALTTEVVSAMDESIVASWGGRAAEDSRGMTLWWANGGDWKSYSEAYAEVAFAIDTGWWSLLDDYN